MNSGFEELLEEFLLEARERVDAVEDLLLRLSDAEVAERRELIAQARRDLHTLKGNSGMMGFRDLQGLAHELEDEVEALAAEAPEVEATLAGLDRFRSLLRYKKEEGAAAAETAPEVRELASQELAMGSVRVPFGELDALVELLAEILIARNRLGEAIVRGHDGLIAARAESRDNGATAPGDDAELLAWETVREAEDVLSKILTQLQERVMKLRMVPLSTLFRHLTRIVHDESRREGKQVRLETRGGTTPLDKGLLELASEALGHLVRNAVNHGLETPEERRRAGKDETGTVRIGASTHGQEVIIAVEDDGSGLDRDELAAAAERLGFTPAPGEDLSSLLFEAGFSTRAGADLSAGRGVGLSAVQEAVRRQGGRVEVSSDLGAGSRFQLRLPLSVSIARALLLKVDGEEYALPMASVVESLRRDPDLDSEVRGKKVLRWRGEVVPRTDLGELFGTAGEAGNGDRGRGFVIVLEVDERYRALVVDELSGIRDIVVKGLDRLLGAPPEISGSTILGDGRVILILDPRGLVGSGPALVSHGG